MSLLPSQIYNFLHSTYNYLSPPPSPHHQLHPSSSSNTSPTSPPLKERLDAACQSPTSTLAHLPPTAMRRELDIAKHDLAKAHADTTRLEERCKMLEKTLKETRDLLRSREAELEKVRRERDRERAMAERRRSDVGPQYHSPQHAQGPGSGGLSVYPRHSSSLDTRMPSAELARHLQGGGTRMYLLEEDARRTPSPSRGSSTSTSASTSLSTSSAGTGLSNGSNGKNGNGKIKEVPELNGSVEEDRARLRSAEAYMSRVDSWSGAQVLQAVHDINSEILQFAASATEMCKFLSVPSPTNNPKLTQAINDTNARIGPNITSILSSREHSQDPLLVQLALQGCVTLCIARALNSFCIGFPSKSDAVLSQIYTHMNLTEPQPTSAKWRALTHAHIHMIYPTLTDYSVNELSDTILRWCADIFFIANGHSFKFASSSPVLSPSSSPTISFSPPAPSTMPTSAAGQLRVLYLDQIRRVSRAVLRLASIMREEIMSTSFDVIIADPSGTFEDDEMVDAFGQYAESHGRILVTMELGLKCITRVSDGISHSPDLNDAGQGKSHGNGGGGDVNGLMPNGRQGRLESRLLLQPKVVLESVLEVLDR